MGLTRIANLVNTNTREIQEHECITPLDTLYTPEAGGKSTTVKCIKVKQADSQNTYKHSCNTCGCVKSREIKHTVHRNRSAYTVTKQGANPPLEKTAVHTHI